MDKPPCVELGKPMNWCARALREQHVEGRIDLPADWKGWKIRGDRLIGPGGIVYGPRTLTALWKIWISGDRSRGTELDMKSPAEATSPEHQ